MHRSDGHLLSVYLRCLYIRVVPTSQGARVCSPLPLLCLAVVFTCLFKHSAISYQLSATGGDRCTGWDE
ncbi:MULTISPECIES: hypothetical protein [unclassified Moorena]|uniref:hypothetical protein n=1 Tax=unclassified Moorena TaxID=2683338 RepID=UPI0013C9D926|nr:MULTISPECIES: hypothetical protein [unclassified Moorena]NEO22407.1 hypothetical protein [Moorena sp. SIO4A5]NEP20852.1 hypothetical protein [Moorena sp. SIO3I6]NEQ57953.1 hypothetical protein [Moorena sp. SIO4A1]